MTITTSLMIRIIDDVKTAASKCIPVSHLAMQYGHSQVDHFLPGSFRGLSVNRTVQTDIKQG
jgi:hypothetical protein